MRFFFSYVSISASLTFGSLNCFFIIFKLIIFSTFFVSFHSSRVPLFILRFNFPSCAYYISHGPFPIFLYNLIVVFARDVVFLLRIGIELGLLKFSFIKSKWQAQIYFFDAISSEDHFFPFFYLFFISFFLRSSCLSFFLSNFLCLTVCLSLFISVSFSVSVSASVSASVRLFSGVPRDSISHFWVSRSLGRSIGRSVTKLF